MRFLHLDPDQINADPCRLRILIRIWNPANNMSSNQFLCPEDQDLQHNFKYTEHIIKYGTHQSVKRFRPLTSWKAQYFSSKAHTASSIPEKKEVRIKSYLYQCESWSGQIQTFWLNRIQTQRSKIFLDQDPDPDTNFWYKKV